LYQNLRGKKPWWGREVGEKDKREDGFDIPEGPEGPGNRKKQNLTEHFGRSSYAECKESHEKGGIQGRKEKAKFTQHALMGVGREKKGGETGPESPAVTKQGEKCDEG